MSIATAQMVQPIATVGGGDTPTTISGEEIPEWVRSKIIDPDGEAVKRWAAQQKIRKAAEKDLRKLRFQNFGQRRGQVRQEGIVKLREYTDPAYFPMLIDIFGKEGVDVRIAMLDHFRDHEGGEGDAALGWMAIFDRAPEVNGPALDRIRDRAKKVGHVPTEVKYAAMEGLTSRDDETVAQACRVVNTLNILEAIPLLINGQVQGAPSQSGAGAGNLGSGNGALAWIAVGTQTAFVSDLTPVVGPNAVAFDPELSTVTDGTVMRVIDAVVVTYSLEMHNALTDMTSREWGKSTREFGWNTPLWQRWYRDDFKPMLARREAAAQAKAEAEKAGSATENLPADKPASSPTGPG
jgi:hypothetical protein